jgi:hypothetical protein
MQGVPNPAGFHMVNIALHAAVAVQVRLDSWPEAQAMPLPMARCAMLSGLLPVSSLHDALEHIEHVGLRSFCRACLISHKHPPLHASLLREASLHVPPALSRSTSLARSLPSLPRFLAPRSPARPPARLPTLLSLLHLLALSIAPARFVHPITTEAVANVAGPARLRDSLSPYQRADRVAFRADDRVLAHRSGGAPIRAVLLHGVAAVRSPFTKHAAHAMEGECSQ